MVIRRTVGLEADGRQDTFRDRLDRTPQIHDPIYKGHSKAFSESALEREPAMVSHEGASFQILNPSQSLRAARIVSFIEDMDYPEVSGRRGSWPEKDIMDESECIGPLEEEITPDDASRHNDIDVFNLFSNPFTNQYPDDTHDHPNEAEQQAHLDIMGDIPHTPIPSISERLEVRQSAPTLPTNTIERLKDPHLNSDYQSEHISPIYQHEDLSYNHSPRHEPFNSTLPAGSWPDMQDFPFWNQTDAGDMPATVVEKDAGSKPAFTRKRGGKYSILRRLRMLRCC